MKALLIIDMQKGYFNDPTLSEQKTTLVQSIEQLVARYSHDNDTLIINVKTIHKKDASSWTLNMLEDNQGFMFEGSYETESVINSLPADTLTILKTRDSAFYQTPLLEVLKERGVTELLLTGVSVHNCIFQTAADAYAANIPVSLIKNAIGDENQSAKEYTLKYLEREYRQKII